MKVSQRTIGSLAILDLDGQLAVEADVDELQEHIQQLLRHKKNIILNMQHVPTLDCAGIGFLVTSYCAARQSGSKLKLLNVQDRPAKLLAMAGLSTVIETYRNESDALAIFRSRPEPKIQPRQQFCRLAAIASQLRAKV